MASLMFINLIDRVDSSPYTTKIAAWHFLSHDGVLLGKINDSVLPALLGVPWISVVQSKHEVQINDPTDLDAKFEILTADWRKREAFECLKGWRNELYTCYTLNGAKYFAIERSAAALFGIVTYGCHITGYIPSTREIWVPRRSYQKATYPGMLDNTVAGGLGDDLGFQECAIKECGEEAGLSREFVTSRLRPAGVVTYEFIDPATGYFQPEVECIYDIVMDKDGVKPRVTDGEAHEFMLMSYEDVKRCMLSGEFKYNCALVLIDFFIRHGEITVENEPDYFDIVSRCHRRLEYPLKKF